MLSSVSPLFALQPASLALAGVGLLVLYKLLRLFYVAFFSPLSKVPGPLLCALTSVVDSYQSTVGGRRAEWIHSLHEKYGEWQVTQEPKLRSRTMYRDRV